MAESPQTKPRLIFDGDCAFCRRRVTRWKSLTGDRVEYTAFQDIARESPPAEIERFRSALHLVDSDGGTYRGADSVFRLLRPVPGRGWMLWLYRHVPGFETLSEMAYRTALSTNRAAEDRAMLWGIPDVRPADAL